MPCCIVNHSEPPACSFYFNFYILKLYLQRLNRLCVYKITKKFDKSTGSTTMRAYLDALDANPKLKFLGGAPLTSTWIPAAEALAARVRRLEPQHKAWKRTKVFTIGESLKLKSSTGRGVRVLRTVCRCRRGCLHISLLIPAFNFVACPTNNHHPRQLQPCAGCFDLMHHGHSNLLESLRQFGSVVIVGIHDDASYERLKGQVRGLHSTCK